MIPFAERVTAAEDLVARLRARFPFAGALDVGTGTGAYALALARCGVRTTGVDLSPKMIEQAREHAAQLHIQARFVVGSMTELPLPSASADLLVCLGNTLPHLTDEDALVQAFQEFSRVLVDGGHAVLQLLNYERILSRRERIVSVDRSSGAEFVRFYDFLPDGTLRFNILAWTWEEDTARIDPIRSVLLRPYTRCTLEKALADAGFRTVLTAGGGDLGPFDPEHSATLLLVAERTAGGKRAPRKRTGCQGGTDS